MINVIISATLLVLVSLWSSMLEAKTQYVTDKLQIMMRNGQGANNKILRMLPSGTAVEVLGENSKTGYSRIRALGEEGWVLTRQLMNEPAAEEQLNNLKERLQVLQNAPDNIRNQLIGLQAEHQTLQRACAQSNETNQRLEQELETIRRASADAVRINNDRIELRKTVANLTREGEDLRQELRELKNHISQRWFLSGAGVLVLGILLGLILPRLRFRQSREAW